MYNRSQIINVLHENKNKAFISNNNLLHTSCLSISPPQGNKLNDYSKNNLQNTFQPEYRSFFKIS